MPNFLQTANTIFSPVCSKSHPFYPNESSTITRAVDTHRKHLHLCCLKWNTEGGKCASLLPINLCASFLRPTGKFKQRWRTKLRYRPCFVCKCKIFGRFLA